MTEQHSTALLENNIQDEFIPFKTYFGDEIFYTKRNTHPTDVKNLIGAKLEQLGAMTTMIVGAGQESFNDWSDEIRHNYLCAIAAITDECKQLAALL